MTISFFFWLVVQTAIMLVFFWLFLRTCGTKKKLKYRHRWQFFVPVVFGLAVLVIGVFFVVPKWLDLHSLAFKLVRTETVKVEKLVRWRGELLTDHGDFSFNALGEQPEIGETYRMRYLPWSRYVISLDGMDSTTNRPQSTKPAVKEPLDETDGTNAADSSARQPGESVIATSENVPPTVSPDPQGVPGVPKEAIPGVSDTKPSTAPAPVRIP